MKLVSTFTLGLPGRCQLFSFQGFEYKMQPDQRRKVTFFLVFIFNCGNMVYVRSKQVRYLILFLNSPVFVNWNQLYLAWTISH